MHAVSSTSLWCAAVRAAETDRGDDALVHDPLAVVLAGPGAEPPADTDASEALAVSIRGRYIDDAVRAGVVADGGPAQVVLLAAGMDARAFRLDWPAGTVVYEVDHEGLLEVKRERLAGADLAALGLRPSAVRREVPTDLAADWLLALEAAGFDRSVPTLWVAEALMLYLTDDQTAALLTRMASVSAPGSRLALDLFNAPMLTSPLFAGVRADMVREGTPWRFGTDDPAGYLAGTGWRVTDVREPGQAEAGGDRWPHPVLPASFTDLPRLWLITATRTDARAA